jgi:hypothetical protein
MKRAVNRARDFDAGNLLAARIILSHPHHHCPALLDWARRVLERLEREKATPADGVRVREEAPCCDLD